MDQILIRVQGFAEQYSGVELKQEVVDLEKLISETDESTLKSLGLFRLGSKLDLENKVLEQEFYLYYPSNNIYSPKIERINLNELTDAQFNLLAQGARILQVVNDKSVLPTAISNKLDLKRKNIADRLNKINQNIEKKKERKRLKEIEKAKKLLADAGIDIK